MNSQKRPAFASGDIKSNCFAFSCDCALSLVRYDSAGDVQLRIAP